MNHRNLDARVARLLGLEVLGEALCWYHIATQNWQPAHETLGSNTREPVFLKACHCEQKTKSHVSHFGHIYACLEVVSFYHKDDKLAREALEQICDERELMPDLKRWLYGQGWEVDLESCDGQVISTGKDESLPLAICKALGELEIE